METNCSRNYVNTRQGRKKESVNRGRAGRSAKQVFLLHVHLFAEERERDSLIIALIALRVTRKCNCVDTSELHRVRILLIYFIIMLLLLLSCCTNAVHKHTLTLAARESGVEWVDRKNLILQSLSVSTALLLRAPGPGLPRLALSLCLPSSFLPRPRSSLLVRLPPCDPASGLVPLSIWLSFLIHTLFHFTLTA